MEESKETKKGRSSKRAIFNLIILFIFLGGAAILLYPTISDQWNKHRNKQLIATYTETVQSMDEEQYTQVWEDAKEYNAAHMVNVVKDAFSENGDYILGHPYDTLLNPNEDEIMGYVEVPKIHIKLAIYHGVGVTALEHGVGHLEGTSLPIGGEGTHAVLSAHRGLPSAMLFTDLDKVEEGDVFYITVLNEVLAYQVDQILTVEPSDTDALAIEEGKDYVTLLTCTPYAVNTQRLLVRGHRIPYEQAEEKQKPSETKEEEPEEVLPVKLLVVGILLFSLIVIFLIRRSRIKGR